jgi:adenylate cyclase
MTRPPAGRRRADPPSGSGPFAYADRPLAQGRPDSISTVPTVARFSREEAAEQAGIAVAEFDRLVTLRLVVSDEEGRFAAGEVRKATLLATFQSAGLPLDALTDKIQRDDLSLDWLDHPAFGFFSLMSNETFADLSAETGIPVDLLMVIREAIGSAVPDPTDKVREIELAIVPHIEAELAIGYPPEVIARSLRTMGDSLRRYVLADAAAIDAYVIEPVAKRSSATGSDISDAAVAATERRADSADRAMLAVFHAQQAHAWTSSIIEAFERWLAHAGLYGRAERPPAICFLDITGYTRLTAERGDKAAAELAEQLSHLVQGTSIQHGGRPVKWLGDGVMFYFRDPGSGVEAAVAMAEGVVSAGLPPAHVGLDAGPVLFQDGDYYGQTVNVASRIAEYARPGEVLVSQAVVDVAANSAVTFSEVGTVELKGVGSTVTLHAARRAS